MSNDERPFDPIEARRRKLEEQMVRRKTRRLTRVKATAPPPEERPRVLLIVRPRVRKKEETDESLEALMARRLAEARRRLDRLDK